MGFMQSYKRLDNLCRDMNGVGVTGYLQDMDSAPKGRVRVPGWDDDRRQLKYYRHLRNRIAHEVGGNINKVVAKRMLAIYKK